MGEDDGGRRKRAGPVGLRRYSRTRLRGWVATKETRKREMEEHDKQARETLRAIIREIRMKLERGESL